MGQLLLIVLTKKNMCLSLCCHTFGITGFLGHDYSHHLYAKISWNQRIYKWIRYKLFWRIILHVRIDFVINLREIDQNCDLISRIFLTLQIEKIWIRSELKIVIQVARRHSSIVIFTRISFGFVSNFIA